MSDTHKDAQTRTFNYWNIVWLFFAIAGLAASSLMYDRQARIEHRLDVGDAKEWKGLVDGNKARDAERKELREFAQRFLAHCAQQKSACNLPADLTVIPQNPEIRPIEELMASSVRER